MIEKKVDQKGIILNVKTSTIVNLENMLNGLRYLQNDKTLPRKLRILEDATNAKIAFNINDIKTLVEKIHEVSKEYHSIRHAVIHNSPQNTAFAMIIKQNKTVDNYQIGIYSTKKGAIEWLNKISH